MAATMQPDRSRRRASIVLFGPLTCFSNPDPKDPDLLRCWRVYRGCESDLSGLLIPDLCPTGPMSLSCRLLYCKRGLQMHSCGKKYICCTTLAWPLDDGLGSLTKASVSYTCLKSRRLCQQMDVAYGIATLPQLISLMVTRMRNACSHTSSMCHPCCMSNLTERINTADASFMPAEAEQSVRALQHVYGF